LLERTEEIDNEYWNVSSGTNVTDNAQANPRTGSMTVADVRETSASGFHIRGRQFTFPASTQHTMSCILSYNGRQYCGLDGGNPPWQPSAFFDLINGTVFSVTGSATASITEIGTSGYFYCTLTALSSVSGGVSNVQLVLSTDGTTVSYVGDTTKGVFASEMMLNIGSPLPYQRVTTAFDVTEAGQRDCYGVGKHEF